MNHADTGRGATATADMKARIAAIRAETWRMDDLIDRLWERNQRAVALGEGYSYEFADPTPPPAVKGLSRASDPGEYEGT